MSKETMSFDDDAQSRGLYPAYADLVKTLSVYPPGVTYPALDLSGELGEHYMIRKYFEVGDMLFAVVALCHEYGLSASAVLSVNVSDDSYFMDAVLSVSRICEGTKKVLRDRDGVPNSADKLIVQRELGIMVRYIATILRRERMTISDAIRANAEKLIDMHRRGVIKVEGDRR